MILIDRLIDAILKKGNPTVAGLDTRLEYLPQDFMQAHAPQGVQDLSQAAGLLYRYNCALIDALKDIIPAVKVQIAYYEMYGVPGLEAFSKTLDYARQNGLLVMADAKRNDIGSTAEAYAQAYLGWTRLLANKEQAFPSDFLTVNPYLGEDGIAPFIQCCQEYDKGIFVLVKTSNPSAGQLQDLILAQSGQPVYQQVGEFVAQWGRDLIGQYGYSRIGAVVGATFPQQAVILRERLKSVFFLVPGYGAQGAKGSDLVGCFDHRGLGAIVNASRSLLCAHQKHGGSFAEAARIEALAMRDDILKSLEACGKAMRI